MPGAAGRAGALSSALLPSLWIWKMAVPGGTSGIGDPSSRIMGRGWGGTSTLTVSLAERYLRPWRSELVHPCDEAQVYYSS